MEGKQGEYRNIGHMGKKIKFIRRLRDIKQSAVAEALGISQQAVSQLERAGTLDPEKLSAIAQVLGVSPEFILHTGELATNFLKGTDPLPQTMAVGQPLVPDLQTVIELYERLVQAEKDKVAYLEALLEMKFLKESTRPYGILRIA